MPLLQSQPFKGLYVAYELLSTVFVRVPLWVALYIVPGLRPRRTWSIKQALYVRLYRYMYEVVIKAGISLEFPTHVAIAPGVGKKGVWVDPAPQLMTNELAGWASTAKVEPIRIPGYWTHGAQDSEDDVGRRPAPGEKVIYHLHGGGYIMYSASPQDPTAAIARGLLEQIGSAQRAFSVEYRLSGWTAEGATNPFPAALLDSLAGYHYLVDVVGFAPADIILVGDSAGGNLAMALTRYLAENREGTVKLPAVPGALVLSSPWSDMGNSHDNAGGSRLEFHKSDYLPDPNTPGGQRMTYSVKAFIGPHGVDTAESNRYFSPAGLTVDARFSGFPRTFIVVGGAEMMRDTVRDLKEKMQKDLGGALAYWEAPDAVHDYILFDWWEPEKANTLRMIAKWVDTE